MQNRKTFRDLDNTKVGTHLLEMGICLEKSAEEIGRYTAEMLFEAGLESISDNAEEWIGAVEHLSFWGVSLEGNIVKIDFSIATGEDANGEGDIIVEVI